MKSRFMLTLALAVFSISVYATTWTVSNRADKPAQYTQVQPAIDGAQPGDTIIIAGSATAYDGFTVNRRLIIFGEGVNNPDGNSTWFNGWVYLANVNSGIGASGSQFYGLGFSNTVYLQGGFTGQQAGENKIENIVFDRCQFSYYYGNGLDFGNQIYNNVTVRNCLFTNYIQFNSSAINNVLITNCVFSGSTSWASIGSTNGTFNLNGQAFVRNCNFMNRSANDTFYVTGIVVENSIFYGSQPTGAKNCTFNNNLTYANSNNALPYGDNVGSGNLIGVDPKFTSFPVIGGAFAWNQNFTLLGGSPALGTGTNGTDMGITGGNSPCPSGQLFGNSKLPVVTEINIPVSSVPVGGTLQVNIKAKTRN